jgi:minor extracellular serine protease Vpr
MKSVWRIMSLTRSVFAVTFGASLLLLTAVPGLAQFASSQFVPNRYTLLLEDAPVSSRFESREEMRTQAAEAYRKQVETRQAAVMRTLHSRGIAVTGSVSELLNAIFVSAPANRVPELAAIPGVIGVRPMRRFKLALNRATQLMNAPAAWAALPGGASNAGKNIKIAIIDSGIDQTHPAFQDTSLTMPANFPICTLGHPEDCSFTNSKVIVARSYVRQLAAGSDPANPALDSMPDDYSPRDRDGHGTAVASCAAANTNTGAVTFTGMAPKAYLGNYKVQGSPGVLDFSSDDVLIMAIHDAMKDGMDIASISLGSAALTGALDTGTACGQGAGVACDPVATAFEAAAKAGMVVVAPAGNEGYSGTQYPNFPTYNGISSPANAPSVIAVGATLNSHVLGASVSVNTASAPAGLKGIAAQMGDSVAPGGGTVFPASSAPVVDLTQLGNDGLGCTALPPFSLAGSFALIENGGATCTFDIQAAHAQDAGAIGIIFYMADSSAPVPPEGMGSSGDVSFFGPTVMISRSDGQALKTYIDAHAGQAVTIDLAGTEQDLAAYNSIAGTVLAGNQLAAYSSRGPALDGLIKPDLVAASGSETDVSNFGPDANDIDLPVPGGLYTAAQRFDPNGSLYSVNGYTGIGGGTSFSAPLVAGAAALVKQAHPTFTAAQIKSALVNSAAQDTATDSFGDAVDVESVGAGRLDAGAAVKATVTAEPSTISFGFLQAGGLPVSRAITITNKGTSSLTLALALASGGKPAPGATVAVDKPSLTLASGASGTVNVTLSGAVPAAGRYNGAITVQATGVATLRLPYMFLVGDGIAFNATCPLADQSDCFSFESKGLAGLPGDEFVLDVVQVVDRFGAPVAGEPINLSVSPRGGVTFQSATGKSACSSGSSTTVITCNTDNYGFAWVDVVLGSAGAPTVTITAAGQPITFPVFISSKQPSIISASVVNAASPKGPISPGSYVEIFGTNLVDTKLLPNLVGDSGALNADGSLPVVIDGTTVSFDVPSAGISVPGYLTFVGFDATQTLAASQVNVQVPWELQGQSSVKVKVSTDDGFFLGNVVDVPLAQYTPAFFLGAGGVVAALDAQTNAIILPSNPAKPGEFLALFANGLGPVTNQPASGGQAPGPPNLAATKSTPVVTIGTQQATVLFSGLAPGFAGLYQVNVTVPAGLTGSQQVTIAIGGVTSPAATLPLQ